ncbi:hypothetical protein UNDKW_1466 [Undibacterium sp. KW1]|uniref:hypothetical protein n=1 Tax=Undibacterium sp. KW1 TaxID=2058624 RepID=UPI001331CD97|nr:hypothetical protein [Undibacterium sp. KW1]BBB59739.1 hypothetical protein UNDKW_1466 [Undibacterium sp. KW1]
MHSLILLEQAMFFLHHPQPVRPRKAVPELQVSSQTQVADTSTIVVEHSEKDLQAFQTQLKANVTGKKK